jgi:hypothetical protein
MAKTILDRKIDACEKFLEQYKQYYHLMPGDFENKGLLPRLVYRTKIAYVLQFLEQMGQQMKVDLDDVSFDEDGYAENYFPDRSNFEDLLQVGDPYYLLRLGSFARICVHQPCRKGNTRDRPQS